MSLPSFFFFNDTATTEIYTLSLHDALPISKPVYGRQFQTRFADRVRHEVGIPTMAVGNISSYTDVNTILAAGGGRLFVPARAPLWGASSTPPPPPPMRGAPPRPPPHAPGAPP